MKRSRVGVLCLAMLVSIPIAVGAVGDKETEALLAKMRHVYSSAKSVSMEVLTVQSNVNATLNRPRRAGPQRRPQSKLDSPLDETTFTTSLLYSTPFKVSAKCSVKGFSVLRAVCDGKQIALIGKDGVVHTQVAGFQDLDSVLPLNLESITFWDWRRQLSTDKGMNMAASTFRILKGVEWNGKKWSVLEETAQGQRVVCLYYFDPATDFIWRTTTTDFGKKKPRQDCRVLSLKVNVPVPAGAFTVPTSKFIRI